jgi:flagellar hook assembly protein FlgD
LRITAKDAAGNVSAVRTAVVKVETSNPVISEVAVTPNPFVLATKKPVAITFKLSESANVTLKITDGAGDVRVLLNNVSRASGINTVTWDGKRTSATGMQVTSGTYSYRIEAVDGAAKTATVMTGTFTVQ